MTRTKEEILKDLQDDIDAYEAQRDTYLDAAAAMDKHIDRLFIQKNRLTSRLAKEVKVSTHKSHAITGLKYKILNVMKEVGKIQSSKEVFDKLIKQGVTGFQLRAVYRSLLYMTTRKGSVKTCVVDQNGNASKNKHAPSYFALIEWMEGDHVKPEYL